MKTWMLCILTVWLLPGLQAQTRSELWPKPDQLWDQHPEGRLRDFSNVGYKQGTVPLPNWSDGIVNIKTFQGDRSAKGDGVTDDTQAFRDALEAVPDYGVIFIPKGTYILKGQIQIRDKHNFVIRGEDMYETILHNPVFLSEIYTYEGGAVLPKHEPYNYNAQGQHYATLGKKLNESFPAHDSSGKPFMDARGNQMDHGPRIKEADPKNTAVFDIRECTNIGMENLSITFREQQKVGHWDRMGNDAIETAKVTDGWFRNLYVKNADHGIWIGGGKHVTVMNIVVDQSFIQPGIVSASPGISGHIAIAFSNSHYTLIHNVELLGNYFHDIASLGNPKHCVISRVTGPHLTLDHHSAGGHFNLFTEVHGGGHHDVILLKGGTQETYWNIDSTREQLYPKDRSTKNVIVGLNTADKTSKDPSHHFETIPPEDLEPQNLYLAQLAFHGKPMPEGPHPRPPAPIAGSTLQVVPVADAVLHPKKSVKENRQSPKTGGWARRLMVGIGAPNLYSQSYLRFDLTNIDLTEVSSATLRIYCESVNQTKSLGVKVMELRDNSWDENTVSVSNPPASADSTLTEFRFKQKDKGSWVDVDLTSYVNQEFSKDRVFSLKLEGFGERNGLVTFYSRDHGNPVHLYLVPKTE